MSFGDVATAAQEQVSHDIAAQGAAPAVLTGRQVAALAHKAGLRGDTRVIAVAVSKGESGWRPNAVGDVALADDRWGPSLGLWQIRSLKADEGTGRERDARALSRSVLFQARAMVIVSANGVRWSPWTVFTSGAYTAHLGVARGAVEDLDRELRRGTSIDSMLPPDWIAGVGATGTSTVPINDDPLNPLDDGSGLIGGAVQTVTDPLAAVGDFLGKLGDPQLWYRVILITLGIVGIVGAGAIMFKGGMVTAATAGASS